MVERTVQRLEPARLGEPGGEAPELSVVMPCLDEAETLERCIAKARRFFAASGLRGEIVVADNGSRDDSVAIAERLGARVVRVAERGYGAALHAGIEAARGSWVVMGDADDSYDFSELGAFVERLRAGDALVVGNRFRGGIRPGAMPWLHRWVGNPLLSALGRLFFGARIGDFHCGLRAFGRDAYARIAPRTTGMEFASELVIKATLAGLPVGEVPTVLYPDGRSRRPHLRTWRDGWRHLRFMLLYSPRWLFLVPGTLLGACGLAGTLWLLGGERRMGPVVFDIHTLLVAGLALLVGYQLVVFALFTRIFAITEGFQPMPAYLSRVFRHATLERGLALGLVLTGGGLAVLVLAVLGWSAAEFGALDPRVTMRQVIPGALLVVLGIQTVFSSFFLSTLGLRRRREGAG
jgi:glycosyltransferase involved in cell wall biosynthesis